MATKESGNPSKRFPQWERVLAECGGDGGGSEAALEWAVRCYESVPSTMDLARELFGEVAPNRPGLVVSKEQTAGRGRHGRVWETTLDALATTFVFHSDLPLSEMAGYSLVVGCAIARVLRKHGITVFLKWPNDIYTEQRKKAGGVLVELQRERGVTYVLTGIGLNLNAHSERFSLSEALVESMAQGDPLHPLEILLSLRSELIRDWLRFSQEGFAPFRKEWLSQALYLHEELSVLTGEKEIAGTFSDINEAGGMVITSSTETYEVHSGQIVVDP